MNEPETKPRVAVLIPVHCPPKIAKLTLGTWLEAADGSYTAEIILGVHENYSHYHDGLERLLGLPVRIVTVKEIDWYGKTDFDRIARYSQMHSVSLMAMLEEAQSIPCDYLAILDHDLIFREDFIGWAIRNGKDLVGSYMGDRTIPAKHKTLVGDLVFPPKFSVWHLLMSARFFKSIMEDPSIIQPKLEKGVFWDTFSRVMEANKTWGYSVLALPETITSRMILHLWSMSFNFGQRERGQEGLARTTNEAESVYDARFPDGIRHLFGKVLPRL